MNQNRTLVFSFGHIPREIGGKQHSGLSQVMWRLANEINKIKSHYKVIFVSTDIHEDYSSLQQTEVVGWNKKLLTDDQLGELILTEYTFLRRPIYMIKEKAFIGNSKKNVSEIKAALSE